MTTQTTHPRARHLGALGLASYALLSPSGKIISSAAAATLLVGGLVTQLRPPSPPSVQAPAATPAVPTRLAHSGSSAPVFTYIEVGGQTLPAALTENPTAGSSSVGRGPASALPFLALSGGGGRMPGTGSPRFGPRHGSPTPPSPGPDGPAPEVPPPSIDPGPIPHPPSPDELSCIPTTVSDSGSPNALPPGALPCPTQPAGSEPVTQLADSDDPADNNSSEDEPQQSSPGNVPGERSEAPESQLSPESEAGAPMPPLQDEPPQIVLLEPSPDNVHPSEAPESEFPTELDDPLNPPIPLPLLTAPYDGPQIAELSPAAVPEPSMIGLMLLGLAALSWTGRRRLTPKRRA